MIVPGKTPPGLDAALIPGQRAMDSERTADGFPPARPASPAASPASPTAAERRTARRIARAQEPPPERDQRYDHMSLTELRDLRRSLQEEEGRVSYWRRILQARIDLLRDGATSGGATVDGLRRILADPQTSHRRTAVLPVHPVEGTPPLPDLAALWTHVDTDAADRDLHLSRLVRAERDLSDFRVRLHTRIDRVTAQLIARYREDPHQALTALPTRSQPPRML